jgi:hypothetical protein
MLLSAEKEYLGHKSIFHIRTDKALNFGDLYRI